MSETPGQTTATDSAVLTSGDPQVAGSREVESAMERTADPLSRGDSEIDAESAIDETARDDVDAGTDVDAADVDAADSDAADSDAESAERGAAGSKSDTLRRLEEEGEVAADYLEELLDIADLDGDIDIDVENGRASVAIVGESGADRGLRRLVGSHGEVLEALQELTRLAVQAASGERSRLMLDIAGYRANRRRVLEGVAARACQEVQRSHEPYGLDPMTAFERKVVHDVVAEAGLFSESEGEEPNRRVVIRPSQP